jgi:hypothetical protein
MWNMETVQLHVESKEILPKRYNLQYVRYHNLACCVTAAQKPRIVSPQATLPYMRTSYCQFINRIRYCNLCNTASFHVGLGTLQPESIFTYWLNQPHPGPSRKPERLWRVCFLSLLNSSIWIWGWIANLILQSMLCKNAAGPLGQME